jgi:cytochrome c oxidase subunit 2
MHFALLMEALGIAPNASLQGYALDGMLEMLHWFMLLLFVGWGSFYAYTLWRFHHSKHPKASYVGTTSHLPTKLEGGVLVLEVVLLLAFAAPIWASRVETFPTGTNVVHLRAVGQQFMWNFQYTGPDGVFGKRDPMLVTSSNQLGIDRTDPAAADDLITQNELHIPVDTPCIVDVMSKDVIHDFCIPNMRTMEDAIPGAIIPLWFTPIKTGTYDVVCAQLCGSGHALMRATLVVDSQADYKKWYNETAKLEGVKGLDDNKVADDKSPADSSLAASH